ncbi:MAG: MmoB/DmpM family protein [Polyangiaceae bacterium]
MSAQRVGPILLPGKPAEALLDAIREAHADVQVEDRGGYWRVSCEGTCSVKRAAIEAHLGRPFALPSDLEAIMPSFQGKLELSDTELSWR